MKFIHPGFYYHYKHDANGPVNNYAYEVLGISVNRDTKEFDVVYRPLYDDPDLKALGAEFYQKPLEEFTSYTIVDTKDVQRYCRIEDPEVIKQLNHIDMELKLLSCSD